MSNFALLFLEKIWPQIRCSSDCPLNAKAQPCPRCECKKPTKGNQKTFDAVYKMITFYNLIDYVLLRGSTPLITLLANHYFWRLSVKNQQPYKSNFIRTHPITISVAFDDESQIWPCYSAAIANYRFPNKWNMHNIAW